MKNNDTHKNDELDGQYDMGENLPYKMVIYNDELKKFLLSVVDHTSDEVFK